MKFRVVVEVAVEVQPPASIAVAIAEKADHPQRRVRQRRIWQRSLLLDDSVLGTVQSVRRFAPTTLSTIWDHVFAPPCKGMGLSGNTARRLGPGPRLTRQSHGHRRESTSAALAWSVTAWEQSGSCGNVMPGFVLLASGGGSNRDFKINAARRANDHVANSGHR